MTIKQLSKAKLRVTMPDGSRWDVPVMIIAMNRATEYAHEYGGSVDKSLSDDTMLLFSADEGAISDWAANNMNWSDVSRMAVKVVEPAKPVDMQEGWVNGEKEVVL